MRLNLLIFGVLLLTAACDAPQGGGQAARHPSSRGPVDDDVVALVDGVPITIARVEKLCNQSGRSPRDVVERLIDFELLAAEARRRRFQRHRDVRSQTRKAAVQLFLDRQFEGTRRPEDMSDEMVRTAYEQNIFLFVRPRGVKVTHVLVAASAEESPATQAKAHALAGEIARKARRVSSAEEFFALGKRYDGQRGLKVLAEKLSTPVHPRAALDPAFIDAALELTEVGEVTGPVKSSFGSHVIYADKIYAPIDRSYEDAQDEVRAHEHPFWLQHEFIRYTDELRLRTKVIGWTGELRRVQ